MKEQVMIPYLEMVPEEMRRMVMSLSDDKHWAVYIALLKHEKMSFGEIKAEFDEHPQTLSNILKDLAQGGLVLKKAKSLAETTDRKKAYYVPTNRGEWFITTLMNGIPSSKKSTAADPYRSDTGDVIYDHRTSGTDVSMISGASRIYARDYSQTYLSGDGWNGQKTGR